MDVMTLSHDELVALVREQAALIAEQQATIARLEQRIRDLEDGRVPPRRTPGHKAAQREPASQPRPPRRKRTENHARRRSEPTARVEHGVSHCPDCGIALAGGSVKRTREVIEIVPVPATITEHVSLERCCPGCGKRWTPRVDRDAQVAGRSRLGIGLVSLIATMRSEWRLPIRSIQAYLASVHSLTLSVGGIQGGTHPGGASRTADGRGDACGDPGQSGGACRRDRLA